MHEKWQELIPFYVAGSLPMAVAASVEQHLAQCVPCRKEYEEWYVVASAVRVQADAWSKALPPLAQAVRIQAQTMPRHASFAPVLSDTQPFQPRSVSRMPQVSITLAAAAIVVVVVGALLIYMATRPRPDEEYAVGIDITQTATNTPLPPGTPTNTVTPGGLVTNTQIATVPPKSSTPLATRPPSNSSPQPWQAATPTAVYGTLIGVARYDFLTTTDLGALPAKSRVHISEAYFNGQEWVYNVVSQYENASAEARESQLLYSPLPDIVPTPTALYNPLIGMSGYNLITVEQVGNIPPNSRVRITYARYSGTEWFYGIANETETATAEARERQLSYNGTIGAPTPVAAFNSLIGMAQYNVLTLEQIGNIPPNTRVRISYAFYNGAQWIYGITNESETANAEAQELQLTYASGATPGALTPLPTATPVSNYCPPTSTCPGYSIVTTQSAFQMYQNGFMIWRADTRIIWMFTNDGSATWFYPDMYENLPDNPVTDTPPAGLIMPVSGFGRVWGNNYFVQRNLGWATAPEQGYTLTLQTDPGQIFYTFNLPDGRLVQLSIAQSHWVFFTP